MLTNSAAPAQSKRASGVQHRTGYTDLKIAHMHMQVKGGSAKAEQLDLSASGLEQTLISATQSGDASLRSRSLPASNLSSVISELAEKYGCSEGQEPADSEEEEEEDRHHGSKRRYLPSHWQTVRTQFRTVLDGVTRAADARIALQAKLNCTS